MRAPLPSRLLLLDNPKLVSLGRSLCRMLKTAPISRFSGS